MKRNDVESVESDKKRRGKRQKNNDVDIGRKYDDAETDESNFFFAFYVIFRLFRIRSFFVAFDIILFCLFRRHRFCLFQCHRFSVVFYFMIFFGRFRIRRFFLVAFDVYEKQRIRIHQKKTTLMQCCHDMKYTYVFKYCTYFRAIMGYSRDNCPIGGRNWAAPFRAGIWLAQVPAS